MRLPRFANPLGRRLRPDRLALSDLRRMARSPSYRAPNAADVLDPDRVRRPELPRVSETERRLLDAVLADPEADAPRRAYAEWAAKQGVGWTAERVRAIAAFCGAKDLVVRRGFVEGLSLSGRAFISLGSELVRLTPLRDVRLVAVQPYLGELARCPHLASLRRLDLAGNRIGPTGVRELAGSRFLGGLRELGLSGNDAGGEGLAALLAAPWVGNLTALDLTDNGLAAAEVPAVAAVPFPELAALDLSRNSLGEDGAEELAKAEFLPRLRRLALSRCGLGPVGAEVLFVGRLASLTDLDVSFNAVGPDGASALAEDASLTRLTTLDLAFNDIESAGAEAIAAGEVLASLVSLNLAGNRITQAGAEALATSEAFGSVESLDLSANPIGDGGAVALVRGEAFASLSRLSLANCDVTDAGVRRLATSGALGGLRSLSLAWTPFGDAGATALAACPDLAGLRTLDLTGTRIGFAGAIALAESPNLVSLRSLALGENPRLPADGVALLRERFGTITA